MYYLRTQAATQAVQFTVEKQGSVEIEPVVPEVKNTNNGGVTNLGVTSSNTTTTNNIDDIEPTQISGPTCSMEDGCISCSG